VHVRAAVLLTKLTLPFSSSTLVGLCSSCLNSSSMENEGVTHQLTPSRLDVEALRLHAVLV
jgi:hypothetical protein